MNRLRDWITLLIGCASIYVVVRVAEKAGAEREANKPAPVADPEKERAKRRPLLPREDDLVGKITLGGQVGPDGQEVQIDLPLAQRMRNIGSKRDGAGMCVMSSITHGVHWHNIRGWRELRDWCAQQPGGGYPSKVDRQLKEYGAAKSLPVPAYLQYEGKDLKVLEEALDNGILPAITYNGRDGVRYSGTIAHMVNLVYLDSKSAAIMDNNGKPEDLIWMSRDEFLPRWTGGRSGWAFFWLVPGPPPPPRSKK